MDESGQTEGSGTGRDPSSLWVRRLMPWVGTLLVVAWARWMAWPILLVIAAIGVAGSAVFARRWDLSLSRRVTFGGLLIATALGAIGQIQMRRLELDFEGYWDSKRTRAEEALDGRLDDLLSLGEAAVGEVARTAEATGFRSDSEAALRSLERVRRAYDVDAVAIYGPAGEFVLWDGMHRGFVPTEVRTGEAAYLYQDRPLFSYLYFSQVLQSGGTAVVAALIETGLPEGVSTRSDDFVARFLESTGEELRVRAPERAFGPDLLDLTWEGQSLLSVSVARPDPAVRRAEVERLWARISLALALALWALLSVGAMPGREAAWSARAMPLLVCALAPLDAVVGATPLLGEGAVRLGPLGSVSLDRAALLTLGAAVVLAALPRRRKGLGPWIGASIVGLGLPLVSWVAGRSADLAFMAGSETDWVVYQLALALTMSIVAVVGLREGQARKSPGAPALVFAGASGVLALFAAGGASIAAMRGDVPVYYFALWAAPAAMMAWALNGIVPRSRLLALWIGGGVLGGSAAQVVAWESRLEARSATAEEEISRLGLLAAEEQETLLERLIHVADSIDGAGAGPRDLLYQGWVRSGLADSGTAIWLTLWGPDGSPEFELPLGMQMDRPSAAGAFLEETRAGGGPFIRRLEDPEALFLAQTPLESDRILTVVVPPQRQASFASPLAAMLGGIGTGADNPLTLVPVLEGEAIPEDPTVRWTRGRDRWEARLVVPYPDGYFDAQYEVELPQALTLVVRAGLLIFLDLAVLLSIWLLAHTVLRKRRFSVRRFPLSFATFRSRVTLALFGFFLLSNVLFGILAFQTLTGATRRTATALASRVATNAAAFYPVVDRSMSRLSDRVGAELLEYRDGELRGGSADELIELGLYEGWIPFEVNRELVSRDELLTTTLSSLGSWPYLNAYQRLPDRDIVATLVPLAAGATALRGREVAELVAFIAIVGAGLSFFLALLVGRTLTRPIQTLQAASERVGSGNLEVRLPDDRVDEFGAVFGAFNRMVLRLERARRALVRTTRRTQAIVEEAATGVIALDEEGRVTLVNPRAQALLVGAVMVGAPLQGAEGSRGELVRWVELYLRDGLREGGSEFQFGDRRIRVRARRIAKESPAGVVLSMEDVTDELRTERVLAWGEMARQVAHEVKNPLTPIKLSVQHIQRAWSDKREEFDPVLNRNVDVILKEIDRLASIARSFSRFGAPAAAGENPLEAVDVGTLADEVLTLYGSGGDGRIHFSRQIPDGTPPVRAREAEFKEVLLNLLENARAAIDEDGRVVVEAVLVPGEIEVRVRDDGAGIPQELLGQIFEPRFSTRSTGTGLGLAIVRRLVESWGGTVTAESGRGEGTVIRLHLRPWTDSSDDSAGEGRPDVAT